MTPIRINTQVSNGQSLANCNWPFMLSVAQGVERPPLFAIDLILDNLVSSFVHAFFWCPSRIWSILGSVLGSVLSFDNFGSSLHNTKNRPFLGDLSMSKNSNF